MRLWVLSIFLSDLWVRLTFDQMDPLGQTSCGLVCNYCAMVDIWSDIPPRQRHLVAKCVTTSVRLTTGQMYPQGWGFGSGWHLGQADLWIFWHGFFQLQQEVTKPNYLQWNLQISQDRSLQSFVGVWTLSYTIPHHWTKNFFNWICYDSSQSTPNLITPCSYFMTRFLITRAISMKGAIPIQFQPWSYVFLW